MARAVVEAVEHAAHDLVFLHENGDGLLLADAGLVAVGLRVLPERDFRFWAMPI
jgi:hypothetical protein